MEADLEPAREKKAGSLSVSELRARLDVKLQTNKDDLSQDDNSKSSATSSLESSFESSKPEMSPIMKKINQFQAQNVPVSAPTSKEALAHSRTNSAQRVQASTNSTPVCSHEPSSNDVVEKGPKKFQKRESSNKSPMPSPSVAALRSQLALNPAALKPGDPGRVKANRSLSGQSADLPASATESSTNAPFVEIPKSPSSTSIPTPSPVRASSRVSDIQQRLALDPNMLLPSPLSGPPSRGHRRGKSSAAPASNVPTLEVTNESQLNRPAIATKARRSRTSAKFSCDDESTQMLQDIERMTMLLDDTAMLAQEQTDNLDQPVKEQQLANESVKSVAEAPGPESSNLAQNDNPLPVGQPNNPVQESAKISPSIFIEKSAAIAPIPDVAYDQPVSVTAGNENCSYREPSADESLLAIERPSRVFRHPTMDSGLDVLQDIDFELLTNNDNVSEEIVATQQTSTIVPQRSDSNNAPEVTSTNELTAIETMPQLPTI